MIKGISEVMKKLQHVAESKEKEIFRSMLKNAQALQKLMVKKITENRSIFTGGTRRAIRTRVRITSTLSSVAVGILDEKDGLVAACVEYGTRHTNKMPPWGTGTTLYNWVRAKYKKSGKEALRASYLLAKSIRDKGGLKAKPFIRPSFRMMKSAIYRAALRAGKK